MDFLVIGLFSGAAYALLAIGFVMAYRGTRVFNLAHGEIGGLGVYVAWSLFGVMPILFASVIGIAVAALAAVAIERTLMRRLTDRAPLSAVAVTLGAGLTLASFEVLVWGIDIKTFPSPVGEWSLRLADVTVSGPRVASLVVAVAVTAGLVAFLRRTTFGLEVSAATSDAELARLSGVHVARTRMFVWAIGGALSGVAAMLIAAVSTFHPLSVTLVMVRALAAALLGGMHSIGGALAGGLAVGVVESLVISRTTTAGAADAAILALMLAVLLFRPEGVLRARA